jgi:putative transcriptional regulator
LTDGVVLAARGMTLVELSARVGVTVANPSILKNGHARALRADADQPTG